MYTLIRRYVKTSLIFFLLGLFLGAWILVLRISGGAAPSAALISAHTHVLLFGFVIMLIMGVAYWMFPRPAKDDFRYSPNIAELNYWLITAGTVIRAAGELWMAVASNPAEIYLVAAGSALQMTAGVVFVWKVWSRIRPIGSQHREAKGEKF